jgi:hypothetical protein
MSTQKAGAERPNVEHTPGPWTLQSDGLGVCYLNPRIEAGEDVDDPQHDSIVARCEGFGAFSGIYDETARANARLILAAPDLYEVARLLIKSDDLQAAIDAAVRALAKVENP